MPQNAIIRANGSGDYRIKSSGALASNNIGAFISSGSPTFNPAWAINSNKLIGF